MACETETKKLLVSFLYTYQANGNKIESERAQQLAGGLLKCKGSQAHSCNRVRGYPSPQNDVFLNNYYYIFLQKSGGGRHGPTSNPLPPHTHTIPMAIAMNIKHPEEIDTPHPHAGVNIT